MASENINAAKFVHAGPLVLDAKLRGPVVHALDDTTTGATLTNIQFDPKLNEIVDIGSNIELLNESKMTTLGTEGGDTVDEKKSIIKSIMPKTYKGFPKKRFGTSKKKMKNGPKKSKEPAGAPPAAPHDLPSLQLGTPLGKNAVKSEVVRYRP
ncbi:hypothetical protein ANCCAN_30654 [Ancylostoma caninum]|uniref:Uncharacterized protein n=1 Tax=Ancylostoma caninum TaxID=29170 RepID=A0A368EY09_ANCCA|nr:hypothetical protein ANCCAN_30654 [Ancylostoma caninum]